MYLRKQIAKKDFCIGENFIGQGDILLISGSIYRMNGHIDYGTKVFRSSGEYLGEYRTSYIDGLERNGCYRDYSSDEEKKLKLESAAPDLLQACIMARDRYLAMGIKGNAQIIGEYVAITGAIKKATGENQI